MNKWIVLAIGGAMISGCDLGLQVNGGGPQIVGSGKVASINRKLGDFKSVSLDGSIDADITIGSRSDAVIKGDDNLINLVKTEVKGDTLHIYLDKNFTSKNGPKVTFSVPSLSAAGIAGSGDLNLHGYHGSALTLTIAGSGDLKASGSVGDLNAKVAGSGDLDLAELKATNAKANVTGSGDISVDVSGTLAASITGSGDIHYLGHPQNVTRSITGSGEISAK